MMKICILSYLKPLRFVFEALSLNSINTPAANKLPVHNKMNNLQRADNKTLTFYEVEQTDKCQGQITLQQKITTPTAIHADHFYSFIEILQKL